ncbi:Zinc finger BED domain-containing protein 5 [Holothuria leucospilota]|uniref:Zinc finger BED domain-containing protein 5 n=1 Tax=Holothuria leucospilota TaxID=206669 RepID=A0A9Q1HKD2_HOLLE|nr:Zinc finger BED domain-containing protein 5 [Holothuria leucospilota]
MKTGPYSLATDGSTDMSNAKLYPVVVRYFNNTSGKVDCVLLSLVESTAKATGENIFKILDAELNDLGIRWENCVSFAADNASVMMGKNKGVVAYITQRQSHIYLVGCACHLMALAAKKATKQLPCSVDVLVDIYFYLDKSSLRQQTLKETHLLHGKEMKKILKHVQTRWLSLGHCLVRLIDQWNPLQQFFGDELQYLTSKKVEKRPRIRETEGSSGKPHLTSNAATASKKTPYAVRKVISVNEFLTCKQNKLNCLFLRSALPLFEKANCVLQHEEPHIHKLRRVLERQLKEIMVRFVKPCILKGDCTQVDFLCKNNQKSNEDLFIGNDARKFIISENITNTENFYENVREFYSAACSYMVKTFPYHDEVLFHAEVVDPSVRQEKSFESLNYVVTRFPAIMSGKSSESLDVLESQFLLYQVCESLPKIERVDHFWSSVATMKDENGVLQFSMLSEVMKGILVIFHSNVDCERFFSLFTKNKTKFRPNLGTKLLSSILTHKVFMNAAGKVCHTMKHDKAILKKAKKSTYIANTSRNAS